MRNDECLDYRMFEMTVDEYAAARAEDSIAEFLTEQLAEDQVSPLSVIVKDQLAFDFQSQ